jgi:hypothetical protein
MYLCIISQFFKFLYYYIVLLNNEKAVYLEVLYIIENFDEHFRNALLAYNINLLFLHKAEIFRFFIKIITKNNKYILACMHYSSFLL